MEYHKLLKHLVTIGNILCILICIITFCVTLGRWYVIVATVFSLLVAIVGIVFTVQFRYGSLLAFAVICVLDFVFLLTISIVLLIYLGILRRFCRDYDDTVWETVPADQGCMDYYYGSYHGRTVAVVTMLLINAFTRLSIVFSLFLLLKFLSDGGKVETDEDVG